MNTLQRRALVLALGMGATAALAAWLKPAPPDEAARIDLDRVLPDQFGDWRIDPATTAFVRAADRRGAQGQLYDQVLERIFVNGRGERVMLSIAYGAQQSSDMQLHRPEVCYRAGGFEVGETRADMLALAGRDVSVTRLVVRLPGRPEPITYWATIGGRIDDGRQPSVAERFSRLRRRQRADGVLVRISSIEPDAAAAWTLHERFARDMLAALSQEQQLRLLGDTPAR